MTTSSIATENETKTGESNAEWKGYEKIAFRIAFVFFFLMVVPLKPDYYINWFKLDWSNLHIRDLGGLAGSSLHFVKINSESGEFGLASYVNWAIILLIILPILTSRNT